MRLNVNLEIPEKDCCDLLTTAWEGGSDYWTPSYDASVKRRGGEDTPELDRLDVIELTYGTPSGDDEFNEEVTTTVIGPTQIAEAIAKVLNGEAEAGDHIRADLINNINEIGACDADTADVLLQVATFGSIIYG